MEMTKLYNYAQKVVAEKFSEIGGFYGFATNSDYAEHVKSLCVTGLCKRINNNYPAGGFIESVFNNDLGGVMERGDREAILGIKTIYYFTHSCPFNPNHI